MTVSVCLTVVVCCSTNVSVEAVMVAISVTVWTSVIEAGPSVVAVTVTVKVLATGGQIRLPKNHGVLQPGSAHLVGAVAVTKR
jgi:hypothetical protein